MIMTKDRQYTGFAPRCIVNYIVNISKIEQEALRHLLLHQLLLKLRLIMISEFTNDINELSNDLKEGCRRGLSAAFDETLAAPLPKLPRWRSILNQENNFWGPIATSETESPWSYRLKTHISTKALPNRSITAEEIIRSFTRKEAPPKYRVGQMVEWIKDKKTNVEEEIESLILGGAKSRSRALRIIAARIRKSHLTKGFALRHSFQGWPTIVHIFAGLDHESTFNQSFKGRLDKWLSI